MFREYDSDVTKKRIVKSVVGEVKNLGRGGFCAQAAISREVDAETGRFAGFALDLQECAVLDRGLIDDGQAQP